MKQHETCSDQVLHRKQRGKPESCLQQVQPQTDRESPNNSNVVQREKKHSNIHGGSTNKSLSSPASSNRTLHAWSSSRRHYRQRGRDQSLQVAAPAVHFSHHALLDKLDLLNYVICTKKLCYHFTPCVLGNPSCIAYADGTEESFLLSFSLISVGLLMPLFGWQRGTNQVP
jgi:hypothetical protein